MKKKDTLSKKDKDDWSQFIKDTSRVSDKDTVNTKNTYSNLRFKFDLHGFSLDEANEQVKKIIFSCIEKKYKEILLITGKGLHSKDDDVYKSDKLSKLRFSIPEYINSEPEISKLISSVSTPSQKDGGEGALLIKLKKL